MPMRSADAHFRDRACARRAGIVLDQEIELRRIAQHAEDDLGGQPGIARIERGGVGEEQVRRPRSSFDTQQNVEGECSGGGNQISV